MRLIKDSFTPSALDTPIAMVGPFQSTSTMTQQPPVDQRIVDEYFQLISNRKTKDVGWLYAMIATFGLKPEELQGFSWQSENTINIANRKRPVSSLHPQWVLLFELKEKEPCLRQDSWKSLCSSLYRLMAYQDIRLNVTDLLLAHRLRKSHYQRFKQLQASSRSLLVVS
jgi:hypothetical protein